MYLIKYGEISLKGENRKLFEKQLRKNILAKLKDIPARIDHKPGRVYLYTQKEYTRQVEHALSTVFGLVGFSKATPCQKNIDIIQEIAIQLAGNYRKNNPGRTFKIEARRTDKSFPLSSYEIACKTGAGICTAFPEFTVDVKNPDWTLSIEVREQVYMYGETFPGLRGLPAGCNGRSLLLLSGGIDSPVAGLLMAKRGLYVDAVYFHTPPYTSEKAKDKVKQLAEVLGTYIPSFKLYGVNFSEIQVCIAQHAPVKAITLFSRAHMMKIANLLAERIHATSLITGECLGQVASQTPESLRFTGSFSALPVFRPLIGMDKEEIILKARKFGTFDISTQPFDDCCTIFAPDHPLIKPKYDEIIDDFHSLQTNELIQKAVGDAELLIRS